MDNLQQSQPSAFRLPEAELRAILKARLLDTLTGHRILVEEFGIERGASRIDMATIGEELIGFEIKSDIDNFERLSFQIHAYNRVFDRINLVVGDRFAVAAETILPPWWGIIQIKKQVNGLVEFRPLREAEKNLSQDPYSVATLLWKDEAIAILTDLSSDSFEFSPRWNKDQLYSALITVLPLEDLRGRVVAKLRCRKDWRSLAS